MFFFLSYQPAAVTLWFLTTGSFGIVQGRLLNNPNMRERLGIAPLVKIEGSTSVFSDVFAPSQKKKEESFKLEDLDDNKSRPFGVSYQAPSIRTRAPSADKVIDAQLVKKRAPPRSPPS
jgi:hypothetical protein